MPTKARSINTELTPVNKAARNKHNRHYQWTPNYLRKLVFSASGIYDVFVVTHVESMQEAHTRLLHLKQ
jgi:hypothetical protein